MACVCIIFWVNLIFESSFSDKGNYYILVVFYVIQILNLICWEWFMQRTPNIRFKVLLPSEVTKMLSPGVTANFVALMSLLFNVTSYNFIR